MSREVTENDLLIAEKCGSFTINELRTMLQDTVSADDAKAGMDAMIEATKNLTSAQRLAAGVWIVMNELLKQALPLEEAANADIQN